MNSLPRNILVIIGILSLSVSPVFAQNDATSSPTTTPQTTPAPESAQITPQENERTDGAALSPMTQQRVINLAANVSNNIDATAARLLNIADRLDRRIAKISAQNLPVERASALVAEARSQLENVAGALYLIDTAVYTMATAENPAAQWPTIRNRYLTAQTGLRDTKAALQQAISALQDPTPTTDITPDATSTPPTNTP